MIMINTIVHFALTLNNDLHWLYKQNKDQADLSCRPPSVNRTRFSSCGS
jgi:hypothetical protein